MSKKMELTMLGSEVEVDLQTQLNCALKIMTQTQLDTWKLQMQLIQKDCELMDAKRELKRLRDKENEAYEPFIKR